MVTDSHEQVVIDAVPKELFIGGEWRPAASGKTFPVEDPATGASLCDVADGDATDAIAALDAAASAQEAWAAHAPRERGEILRRTYELLTERTDDLALLMTLEMGKPVDDSRGEIKYAAEFFRWFSEEAVRIDGRYTVEPGGSGRLLIFRQAVGPCLFITPWNFPTAMGTRKIGPAVAAGCTMIVKPAALTPLSMLALAQILTEAGLPPGVLNIVTSKNAGSTTGPVLEDSRLRKLSFTGSTEVGQRLIAAAAPQVLRVSMELGGNAPFLVFEDADLDAAVDGAVLAKMRNIGEACTAANRFHVHESVADEFATRLAERLGSMRVGRGTEDGVQVGPLVEAKARRRSSSWSTTPATAGRSRWSAARRSEGPATSMHLRCCATCRRMRGSCARRSSGRWRRSRRSCRTTRRCGPPTTPTSASSRTRTRAISIGRSASSKGWRPGWWG